jgi:hypothetical protein
MKYWAITLAELGGYKGFFNSTQEILSWIDEKYEEVRNKTAKTEIKKVDDKEVKVKVFTMETLEKAKSHKHGHCPILDFYPYFVHVVHVENSSIPIKKIMKESK